VTPARRGREPARRPDARRRSRDAAAPAPAHRPATPRRREAAARPRSRIDVAWQTQSRPLAARDVRAAVEAALEHGGRAGLSVGVVLVDDATLAEIHERFLGDPAPTDVIAFDLGDDRDEEADASVAAEIYASVDCAHRVARERGVTAARELALYVVHGALHLCGFDDRTPPKRKAMRAAEADVLRALGYADDLGPHP
jgi:probable rRNA maturation factor